MCYSQAIFVGFRRFINVTIESSIGAAFFPFHFHERGSFFTHRIYLLRLILKTYSNPYSKLFIDIDFDFHGRKNTYFIDRLRPSQSVSQPLSFIFMYTFACVINAVVSSLKTQSIRLCVRKNGSGARKSEKRKGKYAANIKIGAVILADKTSLQS